MPRPPRFFLWISLASIVVILLVALVVGNMWVHSFLRSEDFLRLVSNKTGAALKAETTYSPLRWSGNSVFTDSLQGTGLPGGPIQTVQADQIRAEVNWRAMLDGAWRIEEVTVGYLEGTFHQPARKVSSMADTPPPPPAPTGLWKYLPRRFELGKLHVAQARLNFQDALNKNLVTVNDTMLNLRPDGAGWLIDGQRGTLALPGQPALTIETFRSRLQSGAFYLTDARLRLGEAGKISVAGEFAGDSHIEAEWQQVDIAPFLKPEWRSHLTGHMSGTSLIKWPASGTGATASGRFELKDGLLQGVPVFEQIATFTGAPQFRRMPLQQVTGLYTWAGGVLTVTNLVAESKGLLRVEGNCVIGANGELQSTLRVGVTPQTLQWLPGSRERVFTTAENGYLWTNVRLGGTVDNPQEDLSARLVAAMGNEVIEQGTKVLENLPAAAPEAAKKALDLLSPLLGR